jgi:hypothetical protein
MMWSADLENSALLAKDRHAAMLEYAMRQQQLHQMLPPRSRRLNAWQWLRRNILSGLSPEKPREAAAPQHSVLQS